MDDPVEVHWMTVQRKVFKLQPHSGSNVVISTGRWGSFFLNSFAFGIFRIEVLAEPPKNILTSYWNRVLFLWKQGEIKRGSGGAAGGLGANEWRGGKEEGAG